eukprot:CAMPEP_0118645920 /NCGR_PEP_ID=MMETSP0785-20121206/7766_1 /TAXON_ID=91992 /ORGANISM="Bolidomonas pacifica, Strain CCMP 1866" /LENGTH=327 /DNA_ID=CAMNT_0006537851 /DNA_START=62 /DNA_END=1042 /DNA_ORIENTATION=+
MSEGKHDDESKFDEDDGAKEEVSSDLADLDPVVEAFLNFSYSTSLGEIAEEFIREHAKDAGFENKTKFDASGEGHPLSWSGLHNDYCNSIDKELTTFCKEQGVEMSELFEKLEEVMETNKHVADALPGFVKLTSYEHFCTQMESQATLSQVKEEAEDLKGDDIEDMFSGEWKGLFNFDSKKRDAHLKEVNVPWVLRKMVGSLMNKEGKVNGVVRYTPGEALHRTFNFGILGQQNETYIISKDFEEFNGGFGKLYMKAKVVPDDDGRGFTCLLHRYNDAAKTIRYVSNPKKGRRVGVQEYRLKDDDDDILVCYESVQYEESGEKSAGW